MTARLSEMTRRRSKPPAAPAKEVEARRDGIEPAEHPARTDSGLGSWPWIAALVVLVFAAFAPALSGEFLQWDDEDNIGLNHEFRGLDAPHFEWMFTTNRMGPYQPLAWVSLGIDHALYGLSGPEVYPEAPEYHRTSVAIHALAAVAFFFLAKRLLRAPFAAFVAAAFFALHPLRVESVAWVTERRDVLCGLFYVLAGVAWLRYAEAEPDVDVSNRRLSRTVLASLAGGVLAWLAIDLSDPRVLALAAGGPWMLAAGAVLLGVAAWSRGSRGAVLALFCFLAALLSKGLALVLPLVLLVADVWPLRRARDLRTFAACAVEKMPMLALSVLFARIAFWGQKWIPGLMASFEEHTPWKRTLQAFYGLAFYVWKTVVPTRLSPIYDLPRDLRLQDPRFLVPVVAVLAAAALLVAKRRRVPALAAAGAAYAIAVAPVLGFSQAGPQLVADRYSYLACLPFALLAGAAVTCFGKKQAAIATSAAALLVLGGLTFAYTGAWTTSTKLWEHAQALDPSSMMSNLNLGHARLRQGEGSQDPSARAAKFAEANRCFDAALAAAEHPLVYAGLAKLRQRQWMFDPQHPKATADASLEYARRALELAKSRDLDNPTYHLDYAVALENAGHPNEALDELRDYLRKEPDSYAGRFSLGLLYMRENHDDAAAERELERAVEIEPKAVDAWGNLGIAKQDLGKRDEAIACFERVLALHPGHPVARDRLFKLKSRMTVDVVPQDAPKK